MILWTYMLEQMSHLTNKEMSILIKKHSKFWDCEMECARHKEVKIARAVAGFWDVGDIETETLQGQMIQKLQGLLQSVDLSVYLWKPKAKEEI